MPTPLFGCFLVCVRLGNRDLDFEIWISDFAIEREIRKECHFREIHPQGGFQLRHPNPDFMDFLFTVRLGNPKNNHRTHPIYSCLVFWNSRHWG